MCKHNQCNKRSRYYEENDKQKNSKRIRRSINVIKCKVLSAVILKLVLKANQPFKQ